MTTTAKRRVFATDKKSNLALYDLLSTGLVPEPLIRIGIRQMLKQKLKDLASLDGNLPHVRTQLFAEELKTYPIAIETDSANRQHYEVPSDFFSLILGPRMKYSCCLFEDEGEELAVAEERMLELTCRRAEIGPGQRILDL
ncbi:MAG TPA: class I SAM-dependent methyltransferase, partial [Candidatus Hydrogenedentes bacterium]|nr:class I SAM-dependent methyltransferase [Candidatus Hydrogenedentota bacterium]